MKEKNKKNKKVTQGKNKSLSRKDAMKRMGLSAFSAATMMILLNNPAKGAEGDSPPIPIDEW